MTSRSALKLLLGLVLGLPILLAVFAWVSGLLTAMGDAASSQVLGHVSTGLRVVWLVCLVGLLITLAVHSLEDSGEE